MAFIYSSFWFLPFKRHKSGNDGEEKSIAAALMMINESTGETQEQEDERFSLSGNIVALFASSVPNILGNFC